MYPHERSLVKRLADKPFALIGVNSDNDLEDLKEVLKKENITWRSFQNQKGHDGAISDSFGVEGWPTLFLIDHKGIIRHKWIGSPSDKVLDEEIEKLIKDAEGTK